ncbi:MAG: DUF6160 family protein [Venatoribacter sp.]
MKKLILLSALVSSVAFAEMQELGEQEMQNTSGQGGITMSAKLDFGEGTRLSFKSDSAQYLDENNKQWLILDNLTGSIEAKKLKVDYLDKLSGPDGEKDIGVIQMTLPDEIVFDKLRTDGLYVGPTEKVVRNGSGVANSDYRFVMGMEINGTLQAPAATKVNTFTYGVN